MNISASEFKAKCLKLMDQVQATHEPITVTKHGKPVARLVPVDDGEYPSGFGSMKGTVTILGDIMAPIDVEWAVFDDDHDHFPETP